MSKGNLKKTHTHTPWLYLFSSQHVIFLILAILLVLPPSLPPHSPFTVVYPVAFPVLSLWGGNWLCFASVFVEMVWYAQTQILFFLGVGGSDIWLGCRLMAESAGPQLGAGNMAHYVFSRGVSGGCNGITGDQLGARRGAWLKLSQRQSDVSLTSSKAALS